MEAARSGIFDGKAGDPHQAFQSIKISKVSPPAEVTDSFEILPIP